MKSKKARKVVLVPPVDIILALLNNEPEKDIDLLKFYGGYIHATATEPVYAANGIKTGYFVNEDLEQEIKIEFLKSLSALRQKLFHDFLQNEKSDNIPLMILVAKEHKK